MKTERLSRFRRRLAFVSATLLLAGLCGCVRQTAALPEGVLEFDICPAALATLPERGAFQGYGGWFYFANDLTEPKPNLEEANFVVQTNRALKAQGVRLVVVPLFPLPLAHPDYRDLTDPSQAAFFPADEGAEYDAYVDALRRGGVEVVDTLAAARAYTAAGGQSFFKRDVHRTPDWANAVYREVARVIRAGLRTPLPARTVELTRNPDTPYYGEHINRWTDELCGYLLAPEPLANYAVTPDTSEDVTAEVVKVGTSFSIPPYDVGFLSAALQSPVYSAAIGGGGMLFPIETYLRGDYTERRPQVLVWEYFVTADYVSEPQQRRLVGAAYGVCGPERRAFERTYRVRGDRPIGVRTPALPSAEHYLTLTFSDRNVLQFKTALRYEDGEELASNHPFINDPSKNSGRYFTTLKDESGAFEGLTFSLPAAAQGRVTVQVCRYPGL